MPWWWRLCRPFFLCRCFLLEIPIVFTLETTWCRVGRAHVVTWPSNVWQCLMFIPTCGCLLHAGRARYIPVRCFTLEMRMLYSRGSHVGDLCRKMLRKRDCYKEPWHVGDMGEFFSCHSPYLPLLMLETRIRVACRTLATLYTFARPSFHVGRHECYGKAIAC